MNAHAYGRVSSRSQTLAMQRAAVERAAAVRGDALVWFEEHASARTLDRPELARLRAAVRAGEVRRLYVYRLDRLARSGIRDTFEVVEELKRHGCELITVADGFTLDGPAAEVVLAVMAWAAKMERLAINERISAARDRLEAEGRRWGRPPRLTFDQRSEVMARRDAGETIRAIAQAMHVPRATVARVTSRNPPLLVVPRSRAKRGASRG